MSGKRAISKTVSLVVLLIAAAIAAAGIYGSGILRAPSKPASITISMPNSGSAGLAARLIDDLNLGAKHGLNITFRFLAVAAAEEAVILRTVDAGLMPPLTAARQQLKGKDIVIFAPLLNLHNSIVVKKGSGINSVEDVKGKRLATDARVSSSYQYWAVFLKAKGLDIEKNFQLIFAEVTARVALVERGDVDAITVFEPFTSRLLATGKFIELIHMANIAVETVGVAPPFITLGAYRDWYEKNRDVAERIKAAFKDAMETINKDPKAALTKYAEFYGLREEAAIELAASRAIATRLFSDKWDNEVFKALDQVIGKAVELGILEMLPIKKIYV